MAIDPRAFRRTVGHFVVIGRVLDLYHREPLMAPLVFSAGRYAALAEPGRRQRPL